MTSEEKGGRGGSHLLAYALPAFVIALPTIPVYFHLPSLYGVELGLGLVMTGYVLLIARLFDTYTDTLVGILCDRLSTLGLKRKSWIDKTQLDSGSFKLMLQSLAHIDQGRFRCAISCRTGQYAMAGKRRDDRDMSRCSFEKNLQDQSQTIHGPHQVRFDKMPESVRGDAVNIGWDMGPGILGLRD